MFEKLKISIKRFVICGLIVVLGLPLSLFVVSVKPAQASEKSKKVVTEPIKSKSPVISKLSFIGQPQGLVKANTYVAGQSISLVVVLSDSPVLVWTEMGSLDPNFPDKIYFQNQGQGKWNLKTPVLTSDLNIGSFTVKVFAQAESGELIQTQVKISLQQFKTATVSSYKVSGDGVANISWSPINWADAYLVSWQIQGDKTSSKSETTKITKITLKNLDPGTFYEVKIQPLRGEAVGPSSQLFFKTFGVAPIRVVGESEVAVRPSITAQITPRAVTTSSISPSTPPVSVTSKPSETTTTPTPTPSPSESPKTTTGGWSKLLIALSILIIAAGAAIGGYYGYEWLMLRSKEKEPPESSSRW